MTIFDDEIKRQLSFWKDGTNLLYKCQETAVALGLFDGVHRGHQAILSGTISNSQELMPVTFTFSGLEDKGQMITSSGLKHDIMYKMGIEHIFSAPFSEIKHITAEDFLHYYLKDGLNVKKICCGRDFRFGHGNKGDVRFMQSFCDKWGIELQIMDDILSNNERISSTRIREKIGSGLIEEANVLLGYEYTINFPVQHGKKLARTLQYPTINQHYPSMYVVPAFGVYASVTTINGKKMSSITNVGVNPTVGSEAVKAETFIFDYSGDLYDKSVPVSLLKQFRSEQKFNSIQELTNQMRIDIEMVKNFFKLSY